MLLPRKQVHLLIGASGAGKTTFALQMIQAHERGLSFPIEYESETVGYWVGDRCKDEVLDRVAYLGLKSVDVFSLIDDVDYRSPAMRHSSALVDLLETRFKNHAFWVLDPMAGFIDGSLIDYRHVMIGLTQISQRLSRQGKTALGIHHASKARSDFSYLRPQDRVSGSGAWTAFTGVQLAMIQGKETGHDTDKIVVCPHHQADFTVTLKRRPDGYFAFADEYQEAVQVLEPGQRLTHAALVNAFQSTGMTTAQARYALEKLVYAGKLVKVGYGQYQRA